MGVLRKLGRAVLDVLSEAEAASEKASGPRGTEQSEAGLGWQTPQHTDAASQVELEAGLRLQKRRADEYFRVIEGIERERNEWKRMWYKDAAGHVQAQALLQDALESMRSQLIVALREINRMRVEQKLGPIANLEHLNPRAPPIGIAEQNRAENTRLLAAMAPEIDGRAERAGIDAQITALEAEMAPVAVAVPGPTAGAKEKG